MLRKGYNLLFFGRARRCRSEQAIRIPEEVPANGWRSGDRSRLDGVDFELITYFASDWMQPSPLRDFAT